MRPGRCVPAGTSLDPTFANDISVFLAGATLPTQKALTLLGERSKVPQKI